MTNRRYSIIPARAVVDARLESRDLQVLCFLGMHTDKLGWCFLRQGMIAGKINCGRSTVQRSLSRLIEAEYVQTKTFDGARPHACHAYRVIMDRDDPNLAPPEYAVGGSEQDERYPPVGTSTGEVHHQRAPVPTRGQEVPTHARAHNDPDSGRGGSGTRARESSLSKDANEIAEELAVIAGHDLAFLPVRWISDGPATRVQMMLDRGWKRSVMIDTARAIMRRKKDGAPDTIKYFEKPFARAHAPQEPLPANDLFHTQDKTHAGKTSDSHSWKGRRDRSAAAFQRLAEADDAQRAAGAVSGEETVRIAAAAGPR